LAPSRRLVVTGAAGFLGRRVLASAREAGHDVVGLRRACEPDPLVAGSRVVVVDWEAERALPDALTAAAPDALVHCAGHSGRFAGAPDPIALQEANVGLTAQVLTAVRDVCPSAHVVLLSSAAVYGPDAPVPTGENAPLKPQGEYGVSKLTAERLGWCFVAEGLQVVVARPFNIVGPGEPAGSVVGTLAAQVLPVPEGWTAPVVLREAASVRDFIDADDVADALVLLASRGLTGAAYNVCSGHGVSVAELVARAAEVWGRRIELRVEDPHGVGTVSIGASSRLAALGWRPRRTLDDSLAAIASSWPGP
jgi:GDP-4-dehydro-6-deoxy-D-mannose reductase